MRARDFRARASGPRLTRRYACTVSGSARGVKRSFSRRQELDKLATISPSEKLPRPAHDLL